MNDDLQLNVPLLRRRVSNLTTAARAAGLRPATVSNLCTGKIPVGRAEVRTLAILASLANCSMDELIIRGGGISMMETGIKVLDLFAPVVRGGTIGLVARPGMGQLVLLAELFRRAKKREYVTLFWKPEKEVKGISDVEQESEVVCGTMDEVYDNITKLQNQKDVMLGADRSIVLSGEWLTLKERLQEAGARPMTTVLVDILGEAVDEEAPYGPLDTFLKLDMELSSRGMFPALDPIVSTSTILEGAQLEATHLMIGQRARKLLRRYRELRSLVQAHGIEKLPEIDHVTYKRGEKLEAFLTQPFYVAEPFTKKQGEWLSLQETLDGVRRILDGAADDMDAKELNYIGRLLEV
jgi:F-type H+-transporting ATPase subunit beta